MLEVNRGLSYKNFSFLEKVKEKNIRKLHKIEPSLKNLIACKENWGLGF